MILNKSTFFKVAVISLVIISFFLGYFLRENSTGGGPEFYELSWPIIQSFKKDFLFTLKDYGSFRDYTIPFSHCRWTEVAVAAPAIPVRLHAHPLAVFVLGLQFEVDVTVLGRELQRSPGSIDQVNGNGVVFGLV